MKLREMSSPQRTVVGIVAVYLLANLAAFVRLAEHRDWFAIIPAICAGFGIALLIDAGKY